MIEIASTAPEPLLTVVVPGNPGIDLFYRSFLALLAQKSPRFDLVCDSLRGFEEDEALAEASESESGFGLQDQINHFVALVRSKFDPKKHVGLIIMGHSVGAWIVQRVVCQVATEEPKIPISLVGLLTPTVKDIAKSPRGSYFTTMDKYIGAYAPSIVFTAVRVANWIPGFVPFVASRVSSRGAMLPQTAAAAQQEASQAGNMGAYDAVTRYATNPRMVRQTVELAKEEMRAIASDPEPAEISGFWETLPIFGFFALDDHWVAEQTRKELFEAFGGLSNVHFVAKEAAHAFCIRENEKVVDALFSDLQERKVV
ncbi:hypothetical protein CJU90_5741 [Yarrowia sp. C11]|nr:hypothetical protein CJU90_5741 [Yarrowia sp. C11]KAG5364322.1 hypothetical protein CKK34_3119 [Yarrowia sp. E02]